MMGLTLLPHNRRLATIILGANCVRKASQT